MDAAIDAAPMVGDQRADVSLSEPADIGLAEAAAGERMLLRLEGVTGTIAAPAYDVYLNVPDGESPTDYPERRAGTITTFGVPEASRSTDENAGAGLNFVLDISAVRDVLADAGQWDPANLRGGVRPPGPNPAKRAGRPFEAVCLVALAGAVAV